MADWSELYTLEPDAPDLRDTVLLHHLHGFVDAGAAGRLAVENLRTALEPTRVATFDVDRLIDYRSRRPQMSFDSDRWERYEAPELAVDVAEDSFGSKFLIMAGPEPDFAWEAFVRSVKSLIEHLGVRLTIGVHGIPMAVPHTRPAGVTPHGNRRDLLGSHPAWIDQVVVPASAAALLEYRLGPAGHDAIGFAAHVPHYLAQGEYPPAAIALMEATISATGLALPTAGLYEAAEKTREEIDAQVTASTEISEAVRALELQFDAMATTTKGARPLSGSPAPMPDGEEIAAEFERFLAEREGDEGGDEGRAG